MDDAKTFEMLARGEGTGVFQLESEGMREAKFYQPTPRGLEAKIAEIARVDFHAPTVVIDANRPLDEVLAAVQGPPLLLILDGVTDPHNLGACLRVADGAGAHAVIAPKDHAVGINATVAKVASGAAESASACWLSRHGYGSAPPPWRLRPEAS